jgi:hypothetical protein
MKHSLLSAGYTLEEIGMATLDVEKTKKLRAESLKASGWNNPWDILSGAVETTGAALKRADVLGVGNAAGVVLGAGVMVGGAVVGAGAAVGGAVVGAGAAVGGAANTAVRATVRASVTGVGTVLGAGADATVSTGRFLVSGVGQSSRAVMDGGRFVAKPMVGAGKAVAKPMGKVVSGVVSGTGRVLSTVVSPLTGGLVGGGYHTPREASSPPVPPPRTMSPPRPSQTGDTVLHGILESPRLKRRNSLPTLPKDAAKTSVDLQ